MSNYMKVDWMWLLMENKILHVDVDGKCWNLYREFDKNVIILYQSLNVKMKNKKYNKFLNSI